MSEYTQRYPLLQKYDAPVISGVIRNEDLEVWLRTLPGDWGERFGAVCGPVTAPLEGLYACDIEDTIWALENGKEHRRWNG